MLKKCALLSLGLLLCWTSALLSQTEPFCPQVANYTMHVRLDSSKQMIKGTEILEWTNTGNIVVEELWFHLYWNGFQNNKSDFLSEGKDRWGPVIRNFRQDDWGYCRINMIKILEHGIFTAADVTDTMEFIHPDQDNPFDQTVFTVRCPQPVAPGQTIRLAIDFTSKIPSPIHRTGVFKDYYFIAQWFPKIGVLLDDQWNCHQFHATSNFFADYGTYDVKITLPSSYIIGATGELQEKTVNSDGTSTYHFFQHSVHDFAWTASPNFLEYQEDYEFVPGKKTNITLLLQPNHIRLKEKYLNAIKNGIKYCSLFYGDYPYTTVTCVDPAYNSRSGGMEYPTLFTAGTYFLSHPRIPSPEAVTIHEFGHGYFYGLIGSNEFEHAWMDEGFTSFLDSEIYYRAYDKPLYSKRYFGIPVVFKDVAIPIESSGISRHRLTSDMDIMQLPTWRFINRSSYGANSYAKAELMLRTLKRFLGDDTFAPMIKEYSIRNWFEHPVPQDFYAIVAEFSGEDMSWFLDQFIFSSGRLDYALGAISNQPDREFVGWINGELKNDLPSPSQKSDYLCEVLVRRLGEIKVPIEVLITFENGRKIRESWDGRYRWKKFEYKSPVRIQQAVVDPDFKYVLDINRTNNSKTIRTNKSGLLKWVSAWMLWLQHAFEVMTIFGG